MMMKMKISIDFLLKLADLFIMLFLKGNKVLVHCQGGISRSPTLVIAYLVQKKNLTLGNSFELVREKRPIIDPNEGFLYQLKERFSHKS